MESYSIEKAAKKFGGSTYGDVASGQLGVNETLLTYEQDLAYIILNHMRDTIAHPTANLPYGSLITIIARARAKTEPREGTGKRKMNIKHGRRPLKNTKASSTRKPSRLLKKHTSSTSSHIQVSEENEEKENEESADSDATLYSESPTHPSAKEKAVNKESDATLYSSASDKGTNQNDYQAVSSHHALGYESAPEHEHESEPSKSKQSPKAYTSLSDPQRPPMTPLAEIRE
ncbi:uncharacterized protein G2W53_033519 [Senna tora]|uniref:Uncharacterized protein n=1 Tax=Senna tora TaxID=362788 RepID=A0A834SXN3_9FABA|nr:uncharacterized protein G2W53_033519 [Senna tora]